MLILSGNLCFLNWLTLVPAVMSFDDKSLGFLFSPATVERVVQLQQHWSNTRKPFG